MQLGSHTLDSWARLLALVPPKIPSVPPPTLTWAARVALGRAGVLHPNAIPQPAPPPSSPPLSPTHAEPPSPPSPAPSPSTSPATSPTTVPSLPLAIASTAPSQPPLPSTQQLTSPLPSPTLPQVLQPQPLPPSVPPSSSTDTWSPPAPPPPAAPTKRRRRPPRARPSTPHSYPLPDRALRGLVNCGNSCFINVVLQALLACDPFRRLMLSCKQLGIAETIPGEKESLLAKFVRLADEMTVSENNTPLNGHSGDNPNAKPAPPNGNAKNTSPNHTTPRYPSNAQPPKAGPSKLKRENGFVTEEPLLPDFFYDVFPGSAGAGAPPGVVGSAGSQEDAEEFLSFVLNALHEELVELEKHADPDDDLDDVDGKENGRISPVTSNGTISVGKSTSVGNGVWNGSHQSLVEDNATNGVWEEMTRKGKTVEIRGGDFTQSGITDIYGGALRSEVKRGRAKPSVTREPFFRLSLDIESGLIRDVEHALTAYFEPERLEGYTVERARGGGQETVDARKQVLLHTAPQVLILHLKRFSHNTVTGALNKVSRQMPFPEILEVPSQVVYGGGARRSYGLTAVVTHIGKELAGGHYTCDVRRGGESSETWVTCDDSKVGRTGLAEVLRKQAYLLFYSLRTHSGHPGAHRRS